MRFWAPGIVTSLLAILALLAAVAIVVRSVPWLHRLAVPPAILAGLLGLLLGESGADVLPTRADDLELIVYHTFAIVFIAVGLQSPSPGRPRSGAARSLAVAIPTLGIVQALLGFGLVALWWAAQREMLHPGFGWMLTLGFQQGPGQALALGRAWESQGLVDGGQIGLVFAAIGFLYCGLLGVPLVAYARRRGWIEPTPISEEAASASAPPDRRSRRLDLEPLSTQVLLIAVVYAGVFGVLFGASAPLPEDSPLRATIWGFHFIVGAGLAIALRRSAGRSGRADLFDDDLLARLSVIAVDITTAGAIAAVKLEVLSDWLLPVFLFTACGGALTLLTTLWLARRAFPDASFAHALVLFGMSTGTVSTGLALLRMLDPELKGPVARNVVVAATASVPLYAPLFLGIIPFSTTLWSSGFAAAIAWPIGVLLVYLLALGIAWRRLTPARWVRPWWQVWPACPPNG